MLPMWSLDSTHAGCCLAKLDCRFTNGKNTVRLKEKWPRSYGKGHICICWWVFRLHDISQSSTWCDVFFQMGEQSPSQLKMHAMETQALASSGLLYLNSGCWPQMGFCRFTGQKRITLFVLWFNKLTETIYFVFGNGTKIICWFHTTVYVLSCHRTLEPTADKSHWNGFLLQTAV